MMELLFLGCFTFCSCLFRLSIAMSVNEFREQA
uniref:Uncharacterized protein n=1 Tax=Arundo donax TaxID=35708 RepID=A0A0A9F612_ARUDO